MKKLYFIVLAFLFSCLLLCACGAQGETDSTTPSSVTADSAVKREVYADNSHKNSQVSVTYPVFSGADMQKINADIYTFAKNFAELYYGQDYTDLQLELTFEVKRYDSEYLSIAFTGTGNVRTAAHPNNLFLTKNYDLQKKQAITLSALHTIDRAFADTLYTAVEEQFTALSRQDSHLFAGLLVPHDVLHRHSRHFHREHHRIDAHRADLGRRQRPDVGRIY